MNFEHFNINTHERDTRSPYEKLGVSLDASSYEILGVSPNATDEEIKRKRNCLVKKYHPDTSDGDEEVTKLINQAYSQITELGKGSGDGMQDSTSPSSKKTPEDQNDDSQERSTFESNLELLKEYRDVVRKESLAVSEQKMEESLIAAAHRIVEDNSPFKTKDEISIEARDLLKEVGIDFHIMTNEEAEDELNEMLKNSR